MSASLRRSGRLRQAEEQRQQADEQAEQRAEAQQAGEQQAGEQQAGEQQAEEQQGGERQASSSMPFDGADVKASANNQRDEKGEKSITAKINFDLTKDERKMMRKLYRPDKIAYTLGVTDLVSTTLIVARYPQHFWIFHMLKMFVLFPIRLMRFTKMKWQMYMLDFCYCATYFSTAFSLLALFRLVSGWDNPIQRFNAQLVRAGFFFAYGPLAWSVIGFRNSIAFHSIDKMTEIYVHLSPCILFYCLRWGAGLGPSVVSRAWPGMFQICPFVFENDVKQLNVDDMKAGLKKVLDTAKRLDAEAVNASVSFEQADACVYQGWCHVCTTTPFEYLVWTPFVYVLFWAIPYYLTVFVFMKKTIKDKGLLTLYDQMCGEGGKAWWLAKRFSKEYRPLAYVSFHLVFTMTTGSFAYLFWHCFWLHTMFLVGIIAVAIYNGGSYVFADLSLNYASRVFVKHQEKFLKKE